MNNVDYGKCASLVWIHFAKQILEGFYFMVPPFSLIIQWNLRVLALYMHDLIFFLPLLVPLGSRGPLYGNEAVGPIMVRSFPNSSSIIR